MGASRSGGMIFSFVPPPGAVGEVPASSAMTIASAAGSVEDSPGARSAVNGLPTSGTETSVFASPTCLPPGAERTRRSS